MIKWILILVLIAVVAGALGFTGVARAASTGAKLLIALLVIGIGIVLILFFFAAGGTAV